MSQHLAWGFLRLIGFGFIVFAVAEFLDFAWILIFMAIAGETLNFGFQHWAVGLAPFLINGGVGLVVIVWARTIASWLIPE